MVGGSVHLATTSAFDHPLINPDFLTTEWDIAVATEGVKTLNSFLSAPSWNGYLQAPFPDSANLRTDAAIEAYVRMSVDTIKHAVGTARISNANDKGGVVGPDLRVKGADGLRIVDASILVSIRVNLFKSLRGE